MMQALLLSIALAGQINTVNIPDVNPRDRIIEAGCICAPDTELQNSQIFWESSPAVDMRAHPAGDRSQYVVAPPGTHTISTTVVTQSYQLLTVFVPDPEFPTDPAKAILREIRIADGQARFQKFSSVFKVEGTIPDPDGEDDDDDDDVDDAPFPSPGLAVLVIEEAQDRQFLPASQQAIFTNKGVRDYLRDNCADEDGRILQAFWDDDFVSGQLSGMPSTFRTAYPKIVADAKGNLPWVAISNGTTGYSGPLPGNVDDFMSLLKKYTPASGLHRTLSDLRVLAR